MYDVIVDSASQGLRQPAEADREKCDRRRLKADSQSSRSAGNGCGYLFKYMVKFPQLIFLHGTCSCCDLRAMYLNWNRIHIATGARRL